MEKLVKHCQDDPPAAEALRPDLPPGLADLLGRMLAKSPDDRPQTPAEVAAALLPFATAAPAPAAPGPRPKAAPAPLPTAPWEPAEKAAARRRAAIIAGGALALLLLIVGLWAALPGGGTPEHGPGEGVVPQKGRPVQVLYVLPSKGLWFDDFGPVRDRLQKEGIKVRVASSNNGPCELQWHTENKGNPVPVDVVLDDKVKAADYDALLFAGYNVREYTDDGPACQTVRRLIQEALDRGKVVGALCAGEAVLAAAGTLKGKRAAYNHATYEKYPLAAGEWVGDRQEPVVVSGKVITSGHFTFAPAFAETVLKHLPKR
jgi:putative intracellular protease/amidase